MGIYNFRCMLRAYLKTTKQKEAIMLLKKAYVTLLFFTFIIGNTGMSADGTDGNADGNVEVDPCLEHYTPSDSEIQTWGQGTVNPITSYPPKGDITSSTIFPHFPSGEVMMVTLHSPDPEATLPLPYVGIFKFRVSEEGTYRVSLSSPAWISFFKTNLWIDELDATNSALQENCSEIKKMVEFQLSPDIDYNLLINRSDQQEMKMMILKVEATAEEEN